MQYISTRGNTSPLPFSQAVLTGLAPDGGLLVPESIPDVSDRLDAWSELSYVDLCREVMGLFTDFDPDTLQGLVERAYADFRDPAVAPLVAVGPVHVLELFHGPTLAFKDLAMQFLAQCFRHLLAERDEQLNILGSTSGDTGSAAIHGVAGQERMQIFMMHPEGRTSRLQRLQMTTVPDDNVFNIAIRGSFDDCQRIMKSCFSDVPFKQAHQLGAVNSVNWARVLAQIVYHLYGGLRLLRETGADGLRISVPSGNFGNLLAAWYAREMGLPVRRLICATNENDLLARYFQTGEYRPAGVYHTLSPSMDIQLASNFERYLFLALEGDTDRVRDEMNALAMDGELHVVGDRVRESGLFVAASGDTATTLATMKDVQSSYDYVLDPHTALGWAALQHAPDPELPTMLASTAHPAKFPESVEEAVGHSVTHPVLDALEGREERFTTLPAEEKAVRAYLDQHT